MILNNNEIHKTFDNQEIYITRNIVEDAKAIIFLVDGLTKYSGKYDYAVSKLNNYKYSVYRFDNIGHGKSTEKRIYIEDYNKFSQYTQEIVNLIKKENEDIPIFILGHSIGGMISTVYGINYKNEVDGIILSSALTYNEAKLTSSEEIIDNDLIDNLFIECNKAIKYIKENSKRLEYPTLILHGSEDKIVHSTDSKLLFNNISSKYKKLKLYENMEHEILIEDRKDEVLNDINNWIRKELRYIK